MSRRAGVGALGALLALGSALRLLMAPSYGYLGVDGDLIEHKQAVHRALELGMHAVYLENRRHDPAMTGRPWEGGFFINNLPLIIYVRTALVGVVERVRPVGLELWDWRLNFFELERTDLRTRLAGTRGLTVLLKLPGILGDAWIGWFLWRIAVQSRPVGSAALLAAGAYVLNPGIVLDTAFFGQHDSVWVAFLVAALGMLSRGALGGGWAAYALAGLTKPQAGAFAPLILVLGVARARESGTPGKLLARGALSAAGVCLLVFLPFLVHGTFVESARAIWASTVGGEPFLSCNAANLWWLVTAGRAYEIPDSLPLLGPLDGRALGLLAVLAVNLVVLRRGGPARGDLPGTALAAALLGLAFFVFSTELHENHSMAVLPLVALAAGASRQRWLIFGALSAAFLANLVLFDDSVMQRLRDDTGLDVGITTASLAVAAVNTACLAALAAVWWRRDAPPR